MNNVVCAQDYARRRHSPHLTIRDRKMLEASAVARHALVTGESPAERRRKREANRNLTTGFIVGAAVATVLFALLIWWVPV